MALNNQERLDRILEKIAGQYERLNERQQQYAVREINRIRGDLADLLAEYEDSGGTIRRNRINRIMRDLDEIERLLREYGTTALDEIIAETAEWTTVKVNGALDRTLGVAVTATVADRINRDVFRYVVNRFEEDGLVLSDRIWATAADIREEISAVLRSGIIRGESVSTMIRKVRQVHENETWKIRRLVATEGNIAYRTATAYNAQRSDVVKWVKLNDNPGRHKNHERHRCYALAQEDRYGQGKGVFKPTDSEIYNPHPNCTSFITYVLDERWL